MGEDNNNNDKSTTASTDIDRDALKKEEEKRSARVVHPQAAALRAIVAATAIIERGVGFHEKRIVARAVRGLNAIRKNVTPLLLEEVLRRYFPAGHAMLPVLQTVVQQLKDARMSDTDEDDAWLKAELTYEKELEVLRKQQQLDDEAREREAEAKKTMTPEQLAAEKVAEKKRREALEKREKERLDRERVAAAKKEGADGKGAVAARKKNKKADKEEAKKEAEKLARATMEAEAAEIDRKKRQADAAAKRKVRAEELTKLNALLVNMKVDMMLPEVEVYMSLLIALSAVDQKLNDVAATCIDAIIQRVSAVSHNRRTVDEIAAQVYFYYSLVHERMGKLVDIRNRLLELHRTACLRHDEPSQCVLTNCILRNYLTYNLYGHADKFRLNTKLPDSRSNSQAARYLYYLARINAVQLHYSDAFAQVKQAIRKGPQRGALGFQQAAHKLQVIVRLLMGDIPERETFRQPGLKRSLKPYFQLTKAVRVGDLAAFKQVMQQYNDVFVHDQTYSLIIRLRHNVIKTGLRKISLSYSRISIADICEKLHFESEENAEFVILKAINDNVIDAVIDKEGKFVYSRELADVYSTTEPQLAFHQRIEFCLDTYRDSVQALRYPPDYFAQKPKTDDDGDYDFFE